METRHTPGPWSMHLVDDTVVIIPRRPLPQKFSTLGHSEVADEEDFANARLIAAAPELLDACMAMIEWDDRERDHAVDFNARMDMCRAAFDKARAAISKATC